MPSSTPAVTPTAPTAPNASAAAVGASIVAEQVEILDDGPGIPVTERDRVFDRFVRLSSSPERSSGTAGLGLEIAREIATAHNGHITAADSEGEGARIVITLPRATDAIWSERHKA